MTDEAARFGFDLAVTINIETPSSLVAVASLAFDRIQPDQVERAHACASALLTLIHSEKLEVYRARADMMGEVVSSDSEYWQVVRNLKQVLDPDNIISPGRYNIPD